MLKTDDIGVLRRDTLFHFLWYYNIVKIKKIDIFQIILNKNWNYNLNE